MPCSETAEGGPARAPLQRAGVRSALLRAAALRRLALGCASSRFAGLRLAVDFLAALLRLAGLRLAALFRFGGLALGRRLLGGALALRSGLRLAALFRLAGLRLAVVFFAADLRFAVALALRRRSCASPRSTSWPRSCASQACASRSTASWPTSLRCHAAPFPFHCLCDVVRCSQRPLRRHPLESAPLPFAHAAPHAVAFIATERVVEALDANGTLAADPLRLPR